MLHCEKPQQGDELFFLIFYFFFFTFYAQKKQTDGSKARRSVTTEKHKVTHLLHHSHRHRI